MNEQLTEIGGVKITVPVVYGALSAVVLILFMAWWLIDRKKRTGVSIFAGQVINGFGFGLLPALAVLKAFQEAGFGKGTKVVPPLPMISWLSEGGYYMPCRIELAAAAACFTIVCAWLILRKKDLPDNGDLLMIHLCLWAVIRLETESFRSKPEDLFRAASCGTIMICLIVWTVRRVRICRMPGRAAADLISVSACLAIHFVTADGILSVGSGIADFAVMTGSALLALILTLLAGGDLRRIQARQSPQPG